MEWLSHNYGIVIFAAGIVGAWSLLGYRVTQLEKKQGEIDKKLLLHTADSTLHLDANRDKRIWDDFQHLMVKQFEDVGKRFDNVERKIERVMIQTPPPLGS